MPRKPVIDDEYHRYYRDLMRKRYDMNGERERKSVIGFAKKLDITAAMLQAEFGKEMWRDAELVQRIRSKLRDEVDRRRLIARKTAREEQKQKQEDES